MAPIRITCLSIFFKEDIKGLKRMNFYSDFKIMWNLMDPSVCLETGCTDLPSNERSLSNSIGMYLRGQISELSAIVREKEVALKNKRTMWIHFLFHFQYRNNCFSNIVFIRINNRIIKRFSIDFHRLLFLLSSNLFLRFFQQDINYREKYFLQLECHNMREFSYAP